MLNTITATAVKAAAGDKVALADTWKEFYNTVLASTGIKPIMSLLALFGMALVAFAVIKWAWERRRGLNGGNSGVIWGALLIGTILSAPNLLIPIVLAIFDMLINSINTVWTNAQS